MPPLILYDGHCALCSGFVQTILRLDDEGIFRFAPLQAVGTHPELTFAEPRLDAAGISTEQLSSVVMLDEAGAYTKSDAFFRIMRTLGWPYRALGVLQVLPKGLRDSVYDWVARHRYRIFGKHDSCWMPQAAWQGRFLGEGRA